MSDKVENDGDKAKDNIAPLGGLGTEISALFSVVGLESEIPELRRDEVRNDRALLPVFPQTDD